MNKEILKLFRGYLGKNTININDSDELNCMRLFNQKALKFGIMIPNNAPKDAVDEAIKLYGKDGKKWNQCFHKNFSVVANSSIEELIFQQIIHYFTTYGFEGLDIYNSDKVYIPKEKLEIPELEKDIEMIIIEPLSKEEVSDKLMILLTSGIALSKDTINSIMVLSDFISKDNFASVKNREVKIALYDKYNLVPSNPDEFLRYLIYKTTGSTLKIQNSELIRQIKECDKTKALKLFNKYENMELLSSIFLRNKNLFLAYKVSKDDTRYVWTNQDVRINLNNKINKLRKLAIKNHKAMGTGLLDKITDTKTLIPLNDLISALDNTNIFREIRIFNSLNYRATNPENIVYKIRNGKTYVSKLEHLSYFGGSVLNERRNIVFEHLKNRVKNKVKGKTICIPKNIIYAAPTSEKQFNDNFPFGSYIELPRGENLVYGVHWQNILKNNGGIERVDLDLHQVNKNIAFGWDSNYRDDDRNILFSGDMTDAPLPNGATELFYVGNNYGYGAFLITLNMFTSNTEDVPFEFVIAKGKVEDKKCIDPNNILTSVNMTVKKDERQKVVGFIVIGETIRFYFNDFSAGRSCSTTSINDITTGMFDYLSNYSKTQLKLNDLLKDAGAIIVDTPKIKTAKVTVIPDGTRYEGLEEKDVDIDLSINSITKETIIDLLS